MKKQGKARDLILMADVLTVLFRQRSQILTIYNLLPVLNTKYPNLKKATLEDNLRSYLSKAPISEPFVKIDHEITAGRFKKPRNIYRLSEYYIKDFYTRPHDIGLTTNADIVEK